MSIIRGIGKGLMEAVEDIRPRALVEGGIEQIQAMYVEDRENDQVKLANTLGASLKLLVKRSCSCISPAKKLLLTTF